MKYQHRDKGFIVVKSETNEKMNARKKTVFIDVCLSISEEVKYLGIAIIMKVQGPMLAEIVCGIRCAVHKASTGKTNLSNPTLQPKN